MTEKGKTLGGLYTVVIEGIELTIETGESCFSPRSADTGTLAMLSFADIRDGEKVLDLGCGCGIVGIWAARKTDSENVFMTDISEDAVYYARLNAEKNGVPGVTVVCGNAYEGVETSGFDVILSNPPYHTDFSVAKTFIEKGFNRLKTGGRMIMVTKRQEWYKNKLSAVFGGCRVYEKDGYYVFCALKRSDTRADLKKKQEKQGRKSKAGKRCDRK